MVGALAAAPWAVQPATLPIKAAITAVRGMRMEGPMVPEIPLHAQRPAQYMFERQVKEQMVRMHTAEPKKQAAVR